MLVKPSKSYLLWQREKQKPGTNLEKPLRVQDLALTSLATKTDNY